jgi:hypothetical protein
MSAKRRSRKKPKASAKQKVPTRKGVKAPKKASQAQRARAPGPKARKGSPPTRAAGRRAPDVAGQHAVPPVEVPKVASLDVVAVREPAVTR